MNEKKKKRIVKLVASLASIGLFFTVSQLVKLSDKEIQIISAFVNQVHANGGTRNCGIPSIS